MKRDIEVFVARVAEGYHSYWASEPESIGFFSKEEISLGLEKKHGGEGEYSYDFPEN